MKHGIRRSVVAGEPLAGRCVRLVLGAGALAVSVTGPGCGSDDLPSTGASASSDDSTSASTGGGASAAASSGSEGGSSGGACPTGAEWLDVPFRLHLVRSAIESLDATLDQAAFEAVLAQASTDWEQACIRFVLESVVEDPLTAEQEQAFLDKVATNPPPEERYALMRDAMPQGNLLDPGWNVMVFPTFAAPASGVYVHELGSVLWAERLPPGAPPGDNFPIILAHEFGHSLSLPHYEGADAPTNLMNADVLQTRDTAHSLTSEQVELARMQAQSGDAFAP
jgi:hypothetical protein